MQRSAENLSQNHDGGSVVATSNLSLHCLLDYRGYVCVNPFIIVAAASFCNSHANHAVISIRDFRQGDGEAVYDLLSSAANKNGITSFDPEGPLEIDCGSDVAIQESYCEDGCFLVVVQQEDDRIVGCGGLVIGTPVTYLKSGTSVSSGTITGAIRRVCCKDQSVIQPLLLEIEKRAAPVTTELIVLGYHPTMKQPSSSFHRPSAALLERLNYEALSNQMKGLHATQYVKQITNSSLGAREWFPQG